MDAFGAFGVFDRLNGIVQTEEFAVVAADNHEGFGFLASFVLAQQEEAFPGGGHGGIVAVGGIEFRETRQDHDGRRGGVRHCQQAGVALELVQGGFRLKIAGVIQMRALDADQEHGGGDMILGPQKVFGKIGGCDQKVVQGFEIRICFHRGQFCHREYDNGGQGSAKKKQKTDKIWKVEGNILKAVTGAYPVHTTGGMSKTVIVE